MVHLDLQPELEARLASQAQARGLALDRYVEEILSSTVEDTRQPQHSPVEIAGAVDLILELRKGTRLDGLSIKDLINEGRKY